MRTRNRRQPWPQEYRLLFSAPPGVPRDSRARVAAVSPELVLVDRDLANWELARLNANALLEDLLEEVDALVDTARQRLGGAEVQTRRASRA